MKRTTHARHVAVGSVDESRAIVDKGRTWGAAFSSERVANELAGIGESIVCECGAILSVDPDTGRRSMALYGHRKTKKHLRYIDSL